MWQAVLWLTRQETQKPTEADFEFMRGLGHGDKAAFAEQMFLHHDTRLTVNLSTASKRLQHYRTWLLKTKLTGVDADGGKTFTGRDVLELEPSSAAAVQQWWLCFGTIAPDKIELERTPANLLPGIEHNLTLAIEEGNAARIANLTRMWEQMLSVPPDEPVVLDVS